MKKVAILAISLIGIISIFYIVACGGGAEKFGDPIDESAPKTSIGTILANPNDYLDKEVIIEGAISSECPTGGWINVRDANGATIYVEMHGTPITIPQRVGKTVIVKGIVFQGASSTKETKLLGKGLIIK